MTKYFSTSLKVITIIVLILAGNNSIASGLKIINNVKPTKGNGIITEQAREASSFTKISASTSVDVILRKGNKVKIIARTDGNLQKHLITEIKNNTLKIYIKGSIRKAKKLEVDVTYVNLEALEASSGSDIRGDDIIQSKSFSIEASSSADIILNNLQVETLSVNTSSGSDVKLKGECKKMTIDASSGSDVNTIKVKAGSCHVYASSGADIDVWAVKFLDADASSGADIDYKGNPNNINTHKSSGGSISKY